MGKDLRSATLRTVWEGSFYIWHSLAHVNRELASRLAKLGAVDAIRPLDNEKSSALVYPHGRHLKKLDRKVPGKSLIVRHAFPPSFCEHDGPVILMQPWEFLRAPAQWVQYVNSDQVAELWVNSHFTRNSFVLSGAQPEKVQVLPLGFDEEVFSPEGPRASVGEEEEFKFLYTGGTIERKGIDLLMRAFLAEFRRDEAVRLVVKDTGAKHVYIHNNQQDAIRRVADDVRAPRVTYLDQDLSPKDLAALMRACDCIVQPYRAEGFCLPVVEGMACGLAPIVTYGGATDDLIVHSCGWKVASHRAQIPQLQGLESADDQGWLEPDMDDLRRALREAYENRDTVSLMGKNAARLAQLWSWDKVAPLYADRIAKVKAVQAAPKPLKATPTISLCMIVKNEERVLDACLESAAKHFDQVIVVDTGSTDSTPEICRRHSVDLRFYPWTDSFSDARNQSMIGATGDWIMWIDADDTVPPETIRVIRHAVANASPDEIGFVVPVRFLEEQGHGTLVDHVKVFRNLPGLQWELRIHEQILPSLRRVAEAAGIQDGGRITRLPAEVLHSGYDNSDEGQARKRLRDEKLLKLDLKENPGHPFVLFNLGMTAHFTGDHPNAVKWLKKCISRSQPNQSHVRKAYALCGASLRQLNREKDAHTLLAKGLAELPEDPEIMFHLAQMAFADGKSREAIELYERVLAVDISGMLTSLDPGILGYKTRHNLALAYMAEEDYTSARGQWVQAIEQGNKADMAFFLFDAALVNNDLSTAKNMLTWVTEHLGQGESWANMTIRLADLVGIDPMPQLASVLTAKAGNIGVRKVYATHLLHTGRAQEAVPHLDRLQQEGVPDGAFFLGALAEQVGESAKALAWYQRAAELNPDHEETKLRILRLAREG